MKIINRIKQFIDYKRIGITKFDEIIGAGKSYTGKAIQRNASIGSDVLEKIVGLYPELNIVWLVTGVGEMLNYGNMQGNTPVSNAHVNEPKGVYTTNTPAANLAPVATKAGKAAPATAPPTKYLTPQIISVNNERDENILYVPVRAAAGYLAGSGDPEFLGKLPAFNLPGLTKGGYRAFQVDGDSMFPTLENKEMVIGEWVESLDNIREDHVHILVTKTRGVIVKRLLNRVNKYGVIIAKSDAVDNRNLYPNIEIDPEDIQEIWFAVFHGGNKFKNPTDMYKRVNNIEADITHVMQLLSKAGIKL